MLYKIRLILIILIVTLCGFLGFIWCLIRPFHPTNIAIFSRLLSFLCFKILRIKVIITGKHNLKKSWPNIYISNHQSAIDVLIAGLIAPFGTVGLGKKSIKYIPIYGQFFWLSGNILIDRFNKKRALGTMDHVAQSIKDKNISIWIMPEGTRSYGKGLLPFKKGAFHTAIDAQVPIIPIVISSYHKSVDLSRWNSGTVIIEVLEQIDTKDLTKENVNPLLENCYSVMKNKLVDLDSRLPNAIN